MRFNASLVPQDWPYLNINNIWRLEYSMYTAIHLIRLLDTHGLSGHPAAFWSRKAPQQKECKQRILCNWIVVLSPVTNRKPNSVPCIGASSPQSPRIPRHASGPSLSAMDPSVVLFLVSYYFFFKDISISQTELQGNFQLAHKQI